MLRDLSRERFPLLGQVLRDFEEEALQMVAVAKEKPWGEEAYRQG